MDFLPVPAVLKQNARILALLDAALEEEWDLRYYSYNAAWYEGQEMGSMRDGSGAQVFILFENRSVFVKVIEPGNDEGESFLPMLEQAAGADFSLIKAAAYEPAFIAGSGTLAAWNNGSGWKTAGQKDSALLDMYRDPEAYYRDFCRDYFERDVEAETIRKIRNGGNVLPLLERLAPGLDHKRMRDEMDEIGWK